MPLIPKLRRKDSTPARQVTGTSYATQGAQVKPPNFKEVGSQQASKIPDPVPEVGIGYSASRTYAKMVRDDASVRISLRAGKAPVLGAEFFIDPYDQTPENTAIWEFVTFNLFQGMTTPWSGVLEQILKMYESPMANSIFETVWENREWAPKKSAPNANRKQYTMLRKMAFRPATTIKEIKYDDNGGPVEVIQMALDSEGKSKEVTIPIEKCVIFTYDKENGVEGMPILRSAYKHWYYKDRLYAIDAIQKERHGIGVPDIEVQPGASVSDIKLAHEMGKNLRTNEYSYIVRPPTIKVGFAEIRGNLVNALDSAEHHDMMIMKNIMVQFLNLGVSAGGGRATAATGMDMFLKSMRHVANSICDAVNLYLIPQIVAYNFDTDKFPQLKVRNVGEVKDLQMWSAAMRNLIESGAISVDELTEAWIRDQMDMPKLQSDWVPFEQRPTRIQELLQGTAVSQLGVKQPAQPTPVATSTSKNGGGGNIGKSPSSGAV